MRRKRCALRESHLQLTLGLLASTISMVAPCAAAENWPRFRGPNGTGIAKDENIPVRWSAHSVVWKVEIPGAGNSSPVVWGNRVFLQSAAANGKERRLLCLSTVDGSTLWSKTIPASSSRIHQKNSLASSTPAVGPGRVYAMFWDGKRLLVMAYDFQGVAVWQRDLGPFVSQHGPGTSPVFALDKVFIANDQDGAAALIALDAETGKTAWEAKRRPFRACYSTPFFLENTDESKQLIVTSTAGITSYDPKTGAENWNWEWKFDGQPLRTVGSSVFGDGLIFAQSGDGSGARHAVAVKPPATGQASHSRPAWEDKKTLAYVPSPLVWGDYLFYVHDRGTAGCCIARTGQPVWTERLGGPFSASPILIDGKIFAACEDGNVYVLAASPKFELLAKNSIDEAILATPAVANNRLYLRGANHLFCIGNPSERRAATGAR
jgi:outer membrane protein assembly factor BamB